MRISDWSSDVCSSDLHVVEKVLGSRGDVRVRGALAPLGRAVSSDGGVIVSGQWPFASGSFEPEWIIASTLIFDEESGGARPLPNGMADICMALVPASDVEFLDTWYTVGLCGSASHDFQIQDCFVVIGRDACRGSVVQLG